MTTLQIVLVAGSIRSAAAIDSFWSNPSGGLFHDSGNWDVTVPLPSGHAVFDLNSDFTVTFAEAAVNERLVVRRGRVTFDLAGLPYLLSSDIAISDPTTDVATLSVIEGTLRSDRLQIGVQSGEAGYFRLGAGGRYEGAGHAWIGLGGDGEALVEAGGQASDLAVSLGELQTGNGKLTVRGGGSKWQVDESLIVGKAGRGELTVGDGGAIDAVVAAVFSEALSSIAQVQVIGDGSNLRSDAIVVARRGAAQVTVGSGGAIVSRLTTLAETSAATAEVTLAGAATEWNTESLFIGGTATASGGNATFRVTDAAELNLGVDFANELKIWNNGRLVVDGGSVHTTNLTRWGNLDFKDGLIHIVGGRFASAGPLVIDGDKPGASPTLHLRDGATTVGITELTIGRIRSADLLFSSGAALTASDLRIAELPASTATVTVTGPGSKLNLTSSISIGGAANVAGGAGTLTVSDRSQVDLQGGTLTLWRNGTLNLDGGTLSVATYQPSGGAFNFLSGAFEVRSGAMIADHALLTHLLGPAHEVHAARQVRLSNLTLDSTLHLNGGSLESTSLVNNSALTAAAGRLAASRFDNGRLGFLRLEGNATIATTQLVNSGEINVQSDAATMIGDQLVNSGIVSGFGRVGMRLINHSAGEVRADSGKRITFLAPGNINTGRIDAIGGTTVEFRGDLLNDAAGKIVARDGTLRFAGGLTNKGNLITSNGLGEIFGDVSNDIVGRITIASQSTALFYDDLVNQGIVHVGEGAAAVFLGSVSGAGSFSGKGLVNFEGEFRPGNSPALIRIEGDLAFGSESRFELEIYGSQPTDWDQLTVGGRASLAGHLELSLIAEFTPQNGQSFNLLDFAAVRGQFDSVSLPELQAGLAWDLSGLYETGSISVVPEPTALPVCVAGLLICIATLWRRHTTRTPLEVKGIHYDSQPDEIT